MKTKMFALTTAAVITLSVGSSQLGYDNSQFFMTAGGCNVNWQHTAFKSVQRKEFNGVAVKMLVAETTSADIEITGDGDGRSSIEILARGLGHTSLSMDEIKARMDKYYQVSTTLSKGVLSALIEQKVKQIKNGQGLAFKVVIHSPQTVRARLKSVSGDISLTRGGELKAVTTSGDIHIGSISGSLELSTVSGDIQVASTTGKLKVRTTSGDIHAESVGLLQSVESVSGDVQIKALAIDLDTQLKTVSGDIVFQLKDMDDLKLSAHTTSGDISIVETQQLSYSTKTNKRVEAVMGAATYALGLGTVSGDIELRGF